MTAAATAPTANLPRRKSAMLALLLLVPAPMVGVTFGMILMPGPVGQTIYMACKAWMFALPALWWIVIDRQRPSLSPARKGGFGVGAILGALIGLVIIVGYFIVGDSLVPAEGIRQKAATNDLNNLGMYLAMCAYLILVNSVLEEYVYRWFVFRKCQTLMPTWLAVLAAAAAFTAHHIIALVPQVGWTNALILNLGVFIGGAIWTGLYLRYQSIWPGYLSHAIVDVAILIVGYLIIFH